MEVEIRVPSTSQTLVKSLRSIKRRRRSSKKKQESKPPQIDRKHKTFCPLGVDIAFCRFIT
jgi:hypothetical protein